MQFGSASLIRQLSWREIEMRYRGSMLGAIWTILTPLFMLAVFTFVFAVVLKARWSQGETDTTQFALLIFAGLTVFNLFGEVVGRAPMIVTGQPNLVKKVVFPLEILPVVALLSALFQTAVASVILLAFQVAFGSGFHATVFLVPLLIVPLCLMTLGCAWFLAALGVYVRDVSQLIPLVVTALLFLSPIFYPSTNLPPWFRPLAVYSPLGYSIETIRDAVVFGALPDVTIWLVNLTAGLLVAALGYAFFQKTRKGFADVL